MNGNGIKGYTIGEEVIEKPKDVFHLVYILFFLLGLVNVLPWSFFITAHDYWMHKFRNTTNEYVDSDHRTILQTQFSPSLTITLQFSTIIFLLLTLFFGHKYPLKAKLFGTLIVVLLSFIIASVFIVVDTDSWQIGFFILTMFTVAVINAMGAVFGMAVYSVLSNFSVKYLGAYLNGQGIAAIFTSLLQVLALAVGISTVKSALVYFWVAIAVIASSLILMGLIMRYSEFYGFNMTNDNEVKKRKMLTLHEIIAILKEIWPGPVTTGFYVLTVVSVHTGITSLVVSEGEGNGKWNDVYFVPVITFTLPAILDCVGRVLADKLNFNINPKFLVLFSALRVIIFVPLIIFCNAQPRQNLPVIFPHDYQYIIIMIVFSLTNGYQISMSSLIIPRLVSVNKLEDAFHVNVVVSGIILGALSFLSFVTVDIL